MDTPSTSTGKIREGFVGRRCVPPLSSETESDNETTGESVVNRYGIPDNNEINSDTDTADSEVPDDADTAVLEVADLPSDTDTANTDEGAIVYVFINCLIFYDVLTKIESQPPV